MQWALQFSCTNVALRRYNENHQQQNVVRIVVRIMVRIMRGGEDYDENYHENQQQQVAPYTNIMDCILKMMDVVLTMRTSSSRLLLCHPWTTSAHVGNPS